MRLLRTILDRLEPWALFVAILAILFVPWGPWGKEWWWALLVVVGLVRVVRAWRVAWRHFSLETMSDVLSGLVFVAGVVLLFFLLHRIWPSLVH